MRFKVRETVGYILVLIGLLHHHDAAEYNVTIHPKFLAQNGRVHYETDRWDGHNGLDVPQYIDKCKQIGTESGRWLNRDLNGNIFQNVSSLFKFIFITYP